MSNKGTQATGSKRQGGKGTVSVEEFKGRLRLRWRYQGKRYVLSLGVPDSKVNRRVAQQKAVQIELDIASGIFRLQPKEIQATGRPTSSYH